MADKEKEDLTPEALEASRAETLTTIAKNLTEAFDKTAELQTSPAAFEIRANPHTKAKFLKAQGKITELLDNISAGTLETLEEIQAVTKQISSLVEKATTGLLAAGEKLQPLIEEELKKPEYEGLTYQELLYPEDEDEAEQERRFALMEQAYRNALEKYNVLLKQKEAREKRKEARRLATEEKAITSIPNELVVLSSREMQDAFSPEKLRFIGDNVTLKDRGFENSLYLPPEEIEKMKKKDALPTPEFALHFLTTIISQTSPNLHDFEVSKGQVKLYVKSALDKLSTDFRSAANANSGQIRLDKKTAGVEFLENMFRPLTVLYRITDNGSVIPVLIYQGYNAEKDMMTFESPYIYDLISNTQNAYWERLEKQKTKDPKKLTASDYSPLEVNRLIKTNALTKENPAVQELVFYITNRIVRSGSGGKKTKAFKMTFRNLIEKSQTLRRAVAEIENSTEENIKKNRAAYLNKELKKIKRAVDIILDPNKCNVTTYYEIINVDPADSLQSKNGKIVIVTPTKKMLDDSLIIEWKAIKNHDSEA